MAPRGVPPVVLRGDYCGRNKSHEASHSSVDVCSALPGCGVVWFASGIVMVFKRMPEYTRGSGLRAYGGCDGMHSLTLLALTSWRAQYVSK
jgi:hypothetical protein